MNHGRDKRHAIERYLAQTVRYGADGDERGGRAASIRSKIGACFSSRSISMVEGPFPSDRRPTDDSTEPYDHESTFTLIDRARAGDSEALERLFARHQKPLQRWASGRLPRWARDISETEDLVQEALLQTFKRIGEFEPRRVGALQAYLRQAVLNRIRDELRRKVRQPAATELGDLEADGGESPLEQVIGREAVERYEQALARLKPEEREFIIARVEMGYTYQELAAALDKPTPEAARKAAQRALVRLAEEIKRGGG